MEDKEAINIVQIKNGNKLNGQLNPSFLKEIKRRIIENKKQFSIYLFFLVNTHFIVPLISVWLMDKYTLGIEQTIFWILGLDFIMDSVSVYVSIYSLLLSNQIVNNFTSSTTKIFSQVDTQSEKKKPKDEFWNLNERAEWSILSVLDWGFPTLIGLVGKCMSVIFIFIKNGLVWELIFSVVIYIILYQFVLKKYQKKYNEDDKDFRDKYHNQYEYTKLRQFFVLHRDYITKGVDKLTNKTRTIMNERQKGSYYINWYGSFLSSIICCFVMIFIATNLKDYLLYGVEFKYMSISTTLLYYYTLEKFSSAITNMSSFFIRYIRIENDYIKLVEFFDECKYRHPVEKYNIPYGGIQILNIDLFKGDFHVYLDNSFSGLSLGKGEKILIQGRTGDGKTTFLEGITGKIDGVKVNIGKPENYYHVFADFYQNMVAKLKWSKTTLRQLFDDENDNLKIEKILGLTLPEFNNIISTLAKKDSNKDHFDVQLDAIFSGGQEVRVCLAIKVYEMEKYKKEILILDEPEQGCDPEVAIMIIKNIFNYLNDKTIIMVSHICQCKLQEANISWHKKIRLENGCVKMIA